LSEHSTHAFYERECAVIRISLLSVDASLGTSWNIFAINLSR